MQSTPPPTPIGRIRLSEIASEWSDTHPLNPRLLADEVAGVLRSLCPEDRAVEQQHLTLSMFDTSSGPGVITYRLLADYFESFSLGQSPETISTTTGEIKAATVLVSRQMIGRIVIEATSRAAVAAGYATEAATEPAQHGGALRKSTEKTQPHGSSPFVLGQHEQQQRQEGEREAAEQVAQLLRTVERLEQEKAILMARTQVSDIALTDAREDAETHRRAAIEDRRQRGITEEKLRENAGIIAFMDADNPLSPVEGRRAVTAWCDLTDNGQKDPTDGTGIGVGEHARRWWQLRFGEPKGIVVKHLQWVLAWPARKKGGAVSKKCSQKG